MRKLILLPCVALLTAAAPANSAPQVAQQIAPSDAQKAVELSGGGKEAAAPQEKKICKHLATSGSRLQNRACLTAKEWKQVEDETSR
jgi:Skp family chaperone for outer membrane proteins